jgi:hypothetical protein
VLLPVELLTAGPAVENDRASFAPDMQGMSAAAAVDVLGLSLVQSTHSAPQKTFFVTTRCIARMKLDFPTLSSGAFSLINLAIAMFSILFYKNQWLIFF